MTDLSWHIDGEQLSSLLEVNNFFARPLVTLTRWRLSVDNQSERFMLITPVNDFARWLVEMEVNDYDDSGERQCSHSKWTKFLGVDLKMWSCCLHFELRFISSTKIRYSLSPHLSPFDLFRATERFSILFSSFVIIEESRLSAIIERCRFRHEQSSSVK